MLGWFTPNALWDLRFSNQSRRRKRQQAQYPAWCEMLEPRLALTTVTAYEQYFLELINRARQDPVAEASRLGIDLNEGLPANTLAPGARQPLTLNDALQASIEGHLQDELANNFFSHTGSDGSTPTTRIQAAGYTNWFTIGENLAIQTSSGSVDVAQFVADEYSNLFTDTSVPGRGHRLNLLDGTFQEVGSGVQSGTYLGANAVVTGNDFGVRPGHSFLTGVVYSDLVAANSFYDVGEGIGGATVTVTNGTGTTWSTTSNSAGGYQIDLPSGSYTVTFTGAGITAAISKSFTISGSNVKVDANNRVDTPQGPPALAGTQPLTYVENATPQPIDPAIVVTDIGRSTLSTATITLSNFVAGPDLLGFVPNAGTMGNISVTSNAGGILVLSSRGNTATLAQWQTALRSVTYYNKTDNPSTATRTVSFSVDDGQTTNHVSNTLATTLSIVAVNDPPAISAIEAPATVPVQSPAMVITSSLLIADPDDLSIVGATVTITGTYQAGADSLLFTNTPRITGTFNASTGTLTLIGNDSVSNYRTALRAVRYVNTSSTPVLGPRVITFQGNDGHASSNLGNLGVRVLNLANGVPPAIGGAPNSVLGYIEKTPATAIAPAITLTDPDSTNLGQAIIKITGNYTQGQDRLAFLNSGAVSNTFDATTGTLTLTGVKSLATYQSMLRTVTYQNVSYNPNTAPRTVSITVLDANCNVSLSVSRTISITAVNDPPQISAIETTAANYSTTPVAISSTLLVTDADDATLASATIKFSAGYQQGQDLLTFVNTAKIKGSFDAATGTLTLTGVDTVSNYRTALRAVLYSNSGTTPTSGTRTISLQVNDGHIAGNSVTRGLIVG